MAYRLASILPRLITSNQMDFIKGRSAVSNIRKVLTVLDEIKLRPIKHSTSYILTIDAEKAFDNVRWKWLDLVLDRLGVPGAL